MLRCWIITVSLLYFTTSLSGQEETPLTFNWTTNSVTIGDLLSAITEQTGFDFSYNTEDIDPSQSIPFGLSRGSLAKVLEVLKQEAAIGYVFVDDQIILNLAEDSPVVPIYTVSGYLADSLTGESLIGATVAVAGGARGAVTNAFGYYSLSLREGDHQLVFSYIGYQKQTQDIRLNTDVQIDRYLSIEALDLPNVLVTLPAAAIGGHLGAPSMSASDLSNMPEFGGEAGLIKGLQTLPGIKGHGDGSAFFYTRGGGKDQNLIIIDDAPIFNPAHLFGFYSMVIPDFTKEIKVYKSDVPVSLGDRLSSIVSIRTKDGNLNRFKLSGSLNPLVNRFSVEFPTAKKRGSIFTSLRRSNFEWIYQNSNPDAEVSFGDFSFKWNHKIHERDRIFFTLITAADRLSNSSDGLGGVNWGNAATTLRWNHLFGPRLFANLILYSGAYNYRLFLNQDAWESGIGTLSLKWDFTQISKANVTSRFGLEIAAYGFNPGRIASGNLLSLVPEINERRARKRVVYYESEFRVGKRWQIDLGLRLPSWDNIGPAEYLLFNQSELVDTIAAAAGPYRSFFNVDPRLSITYELGSASFFKLSAGRYHQFLQLISNSTSPFNSLEVWLPSGPNIQPQLGDQVDLNFTTTSDRLKTRFSIATYYKKLREQIDYRPHANILLNPLLEGEFLFGELESYGLEFSAEKKVGRLHGYLNYTWSRVFRRTPGINNEHWYPAFQDRPHDFSAMLHYQCSPRLLLSAYFTAYTGSAFSSPNGFYRFNDQVVPIFGEKHNDRLPSYRRLDLALQYRLNRKTDRRFQHSLNLSIYNALNRRNAAAVNFNKVIDVDDRPVIQTNYALERNLVTTQASLIPLFPSVTYKFSL